MTMIVGEMTMHRIIIIINNDRDNDLQEEQEIVPRLVVRPHDLNVPSEFRRSQNHSTEDQGRDGWQQNKLELHLH